MGDAGVQGKENGGESLNLGVGVGVARFRGCKKMWLMTTRNCNYSEKKKKVGDLRKNKLKSLGSQKEMESLCNRHYNVCFDRFVRAFAFEFDLIEQIKEKKETKFHN